MRIDKHLSESCPELSRSYIQRPPKSGQVLVNRKGVKASYVVSEDDHVELEVPAAVEPEIETGAMDLDTLYEDQDIILINKSRGMAAHPTVGHYSRTLISDPMYHCKDRLSGINGVMRPGIIHRTNMDTTSVSIACKDDTVYNSTAVRLKEHSITRRYQAIVHGVIKEEEGTVVASIGCHQTERKKMHINCSNGRNVITHYRVLQRFSQFIYMECRLEIGWTHQVRVYMVSPYHPLLGDHVYDPAKYPVLGLAGQTPHAGTLGVIHPRTGGYMESIVPLLEYFDKLLHTLR